MKVEEGLYDAMAVSVTEGWSLLLRLLHMRQEILTMASEFYCRASEVSHANVALLTSLTRPGWPVGEECNQTLTSHLWLSFDLLRG